MAAIAYLRVSSEESAERQTIENQRQYAIQQCQTHGIDLVELYEDNGVSGAVALADRPAGGRLIQDVQSGRFDTVLVYRVDRLARNTLDLLQTAAYLSEYGVAIRSLSEPFDTSGPMGKFLMALLGLIAELERSTILERTEMGKTRTAREGRWNGGEEPYGLKVDVDGRLVLNPREAPTAQRIFQLALEGSSGCAIVALFNAEGVPTRTGGPWSQSIVNRILNNRLYTGQAIYRKFKAVHNAKGRVVGREKTPTESHIFYTVPALITEEEFDEVHRARERRPQCRPRFSHRDYALVGFIRCACGKPMCGKTNTTRGQRYYYYKCVTSWTPGANCGARAVSAEHLEQTIWSDVQQFIRNPGEVVQRLRQQAREEVPTVAEAERLEATLKGKQGEKDRLLTAFRKGLLEEDELKTQLGQMREEIRQLTERLQELVSRRAHAEHLRSQVRQAQTVLTRLATKVENLTPETRREILAALVESVVIRDHGDRQTAAITYRFREEPVAAVAGRDGAGETARAKTLPATVLYISRSLTAIRCASSPLTPA